MKQATTMLWRTSNATTINCKLCESNQKKGINAKPQSDSDSANLGDIEGPVMSPQNLRIREIPDSQFNFIRSRGRKRLRRATVNYDDAHKDDNDDQADDERDDLINKHRNSKNCDEKHSSRNNESNLENDSDQ